MLWLTLVLNLEHNIARNINLLFFLPSAAIACIFHKMTGKLELKKVLPAILFGCIAAAIASFVSKSIDISLIKKCFGVLLIITGIHELLYKTK